MSDDLPQRLVQVGALSALALMTFTSPAAGQWERIPVDPEMAVKEGFDTDRAIFWRSPNFIPLRNPEWRSLRDARRSRDVSDETVVVAFEVQGRTLTLVSSQMSYHHVAQGEMEGEPWMVTF